MDESLSQNSATERAYLVFEPRRAISSIRSWARRHAAELMCAGLLAGMSWQMLAVISRKLFGARAAVLAVALFSLEPTVLAHGRVVQTDVPAAFGYLLFFMALYRYWLAPSMRRAGWLGLAAAVAILAKYSMLLVGVVLAFFFLVLLWRAVRAKQRPTGVIIHAASIALVILVLINAAYFFKHRSLVDADLQWLDES